MVRYTKRFYIKEYTFQLVVTLLSLIMERRKREGDGEGGRYWVRGRQLVVKYLANLTVCDTLVY